MRVVPPSDRVLTLVETPEDPPQPGFRPVPFRTHSSDSPESGTLDLPTLCVSTGIVRNRWVCTSRPLGIRVARRVYSREPDWSLPFLSEYPRVNCLPLSLIPVDGEGVGEESPSSCMFSGPDRGVVGDSWVMGGRKIKKRKDCLRSKLPGVLEPWCRRIPNPEVS